MLAAILIFCGSSHARAQSAINDIPAVINATDATITKLGHATMTVGRDVVTDPATLHADTLIQVKEIEWNTEAGTAQKRMARRRAPGTDFYDKDTSWWLDIWWFTYEYPSIDADGNEVTLTAMACMPDEDADDINNIIIGCHVTITSNKECPSMYNHGGSAASDVSLLMNHAGSGLFFPTLGSDQPYFNLVILPDYEGYGLTKHRAHPYLYQELTARQVVDAVRYGKALYETSSEVSSIRHPFREDWRSICVGYSQGGSVALATQRFIEQNGLTDELQLAGSVCGDGPYDLLSTLMYYVGKDNDGKDMTMPVVLPLILKGMCDSNPYMKNHQVSDYLTERFLETGILDWLTQKEKTTDDITDAWKKLYKDGKDGDKNYFRGVLTEDGKAKLSNILKPMGLAYFRQLYADNKSNYFLEQGIPLPTHRGLMEDLHFALESNNMTVGWQPQHAIFLYHSFEDTVVPEKNRERATFTLGNDWVIELQASGDVQYDHVGTGTQFFLGTEEFNAIRKLAYANVHQTVYEVSQMKKSD